MADVKKVWNDEGGRLYLSLPSDEFELLDNAIYKVGIDQMGRFFLMKSSDGFTFDYKLYGLETKLVERVEKTYRATHGNLGILLNGLKGTGKTVTSKIIASKINQPIILVDTKIEGIQFFLNSITQDVTIFIDEYEKVFGDSAGMLTIMDGASNSSFRRLFLLTTNELYVDKNLIQRPGRVRYLKKFSDLKPEVITEIVDDILEYTDFRNECINFISNLETITVDIVKAIVNEVNIHMEGPSAFEDVFNVKKLSGKYNVQVRDENNNLVELATSANIYPRPTYNDGIVGYNFEIDGQAIGTISRVLNWTTIEVSPFKSRKGKNLGFDKPLILKMSDADMINYAFAYDGYGSSLVDIPVKAKSELGASLLGKIEHANDNDYYDDEEDVVDQDSAPKQSLSASVAVPTSFHLQKAEAPSGDWESKGISEG